MMKLVMLVAPLGMTACLGDGSEIAAGDREHAPVASTGGDVLTGDGFVEFTTAENTTDKIAGLSSRDGDPDLDFAIHLRDDGAVAVLEGGVQRASAGSYQAGDAFRIEVAHGLVSYARNGVVFHRSDTAPSFPLRFDASLGSPGATIEDAVLVGPLVVFSNASRVFRWKAFCDCVDWIEGRYLDLTRAADDQDGEPRRSSIDFFQVDPSIGNITPGGFWFRSAPVSGEGVFFASRKPFRIQGDPVDVVVTPPRRKQVGDTVGPGDTWVDGEPPSVFSEGGVQTAHFQDLSGETGPDQLWFRDAIVGVRFRIQGAIHYGFVELNWVLPGNNFFLGRYRPLRWGYNTTANEAFVIPP